MKEDKPYIPWTEFDPPEHFEERKVPVTLDHATGRVRVEAVLGWCKKAEEYLAKCKQEEISVSTGKESL